MTADTAHRSHRSEPANGNGLTEGARADSVERPVSPDWFDENAYLAAHPDALAAVASGAFVSAFDHYNRNGRDWPIFGAAHEPHDGLQRTAVEARAANPLALNASLEALLLSPHGGILIVGWVDDRDAPLERVAVSGTGWVLNLADSRIARFRRTDVESALGTTAAHAFGFYAFTYTATAFDAGGPCHVHLQLKDGREFALAVEPRRVGEIELRDTVLGYVATADMFGNRQVETVRALHGPLSAAIVRHNRDIGRQIVSGVYIERFGPRLRKPRASMIVCLYGKPEFLFLQSALYRGGAGFEDFEMIYVSNSPEMAEQLMKDVRTSALVYDLPQTLILLPGNAGFGAANNVAATHAASDRLLFVNPDVFPRDPEWARKHTQLVREGAAGQTRLFGAPLFYDDGSLMHGGMYFEYDTGLSVRPTAVLGQRLIRVEHYGKGAPPNTTEFTRTRAVPAVTGAFISADRAWYETLGGFTEDYVFGHYEDADLCLKSLSKGIAPWLQDIKLWHLEGKGSTRLPVHEGGSLVNRALFSQRWDGMIGAGLTGPAPRHPLLRAPAPAVDAGKGPKRRTRAGERSR